MVYETLQWTKSYVKLKTINHVDKIKLQISNKFQQLPKNSATVRVNNRCIVIGQNRVKTMMCNKTGASPNWEDIRNEIDDKKLILLLKTVNYAFNNKIIRWHFYFTIVVGSCLAFLPNSVTGAISPEVMEAYKSSKHKKLIEPKKEV